MTEKCPPRPRLPHLLRLVAVGCVWLFPFRAVSGACMLPIPTVACEFLNSDAVFVGTVVSVQVAPPRGQEYDGWLYDLTVQKSFRGPQDENYPSVYRK
jgi:hypothetical protein